MSRDWRGLAALDNLDEIERRVRNLFSDPCRSWTRIDWYESRPSFVAPSIKPGLALAGEYGGEIKRTANEVFVSLGFADGFGIYTTHATADDARMAMGSGGGEYAWVDIKGGTDSQAGAGDRVSVTSRNSQGAVRHVILVPEGGEDSYLLAEREARVIEAVADRMQAEDESWGEYTGPEYVRGLAAKVRSNHYPLTWER